MRVDTFRDLHSQREKLCFRVFVVKTSIVYGTEFWFVKNILSFHCHGAESFTLILLFFFCKHSQQSHVIFACFMPVLHIWCILLFLISNTISVERFADLGMVRTVDDFLLGWKFANSSFQRYTGTTATYRRPKTTLSTKNVKCLYNN